MLDRAAIALLRPLLEHGARVLHRLRVTANAVTLIGFAIGIAAAVAIAQQAYAWGLLLLLTSRLCDGLDGALARLTQPTDRGAYLDIMLDFLFYASHPAGVRDRRTRGSALAGRGAAGRIHRHRLELSRLSRCSPSGAAQRSEAYPRKGIFYLGGLTEATETLICFALMCVWPAWFALWAYGFAALCAVTIVTRLWAGWRAFG